MIDAQKISIGKVRRAYALNDHDVDGLLAALWPQSLFPLELWQEVYEKFWCNFAVRNETIYSFVTPIFPESTGITEKYFFPHIYAIDIAKLFRSVSINVHMNAVRLGLKYIIEFTYEKDSDVKFKSDIDSLLKSLEEIEKKSPHKFYHVDKEGFIDLVRDKSVGIIQTQYDFITALYLDTILVNKSDAILYLNSINFPLQQEVKGITRNFVNSIIKVSLEKNVPTEQLEEKLTEENTENSSFEQYNIIHIPASLWEGKPPAAVRDAMSADYDISVIAYVLYNWCGVKKTQIGRLLSDKEFSDDKSYRNITNALLKKAASLTIGKA